MDCYSFFNFFKIHGIRIAILVIGVCPNAHYFLEFQSLVRAQSHKVQD